MALRNELKNKLRNFVRNKFESDDSTIDNDIDNISDEPYAILTVPTHPTHNIVTDPQTEHDIIEGIERGYFSETFDPSRHELERLQVLDQTVIDGLQSNLQTQYDAVSRKVSAMILEKQPLYEKELERVIQMQLALEWAGSVCSSSRNGLNASLDTFTKRSLEMLSNFRKKTVLQGLQRALKTIKTLQQTDIRLREMLDDGDFSGAIQLCLECQKAASTFRHYKCISDLSSKLQDTLVIIEEQLDHALSKICHGFNDIFYTELQRSYSLLDKSQMALDQLHMHYASVIHNKAFQIVLGYVQLCTPETDVNFQRCQYNELCTFVSSECMLECLVDLCRALWDVLVSYHHILDWHENQMSEQQDGTVEGNFNRRYTEQKLEHGQSRIWQDLQNKVKVYVSASSFSHFKYDQFIKALDIINRLILVGKEFCGSLSEGLQESIQMQTVNYFRAYHHSRMDELRLFFETEGWELCPVKSSFQCLHLQEFKFIKALSSSESGANEVSEDRCFFERFISSDESPFDASIQQADVSEDILLDTLNGEESSSSDDENIELEDGFSSPSKKTTEMDMVSFSNKRSIILANTTLNVLRLVGKYMQMLSVLQPIAFEVIQCLCELFDYYLYCVFYFFATDCPLDTRDLLLSTRLRASLRRIDEQLISVNETQSASGSIGLPIVSLDILINDSNSLFGLSQRIVAVESLVQLGEQYGLIQPYLERAIPSGKQAFLQQFYSQVVKVCAELRLAAYFPVVEKALQLESVSAQMLTVRWDVKELMSEHNSYVDLVLQQMSTFAAQLARVNTSVSIPSPALAVLWQHCMSLANQVLIEGFSNVKKCSNEGRALMQLDFQQYLLKLEKISGIKSSQIYGRLTVENFIKAYYLPEDQVEGWLNDNKKDYTNKQLVGLLQSLPHLSRKTRSRLVGLFDEGTPKLAQKIIQQIQQSASPNVTSNMKSQNSSGSLEKYK